MNFSEIVRLRSRWNNSLRELWNLMLTHQVKWNKSLNARRHFTRRRRISRTKCISQIPKGIYFVEKKIPFVRWQKVFSFLVEARGIEPLSKKLFLTVSPSADNPLISRYTRRLTGWHREKSVVHDLRADGPKFTFTAKWRPSTAAVLWGRTAARLGC